MRKQQSGVMLLEALIAILIFSLGVLGIVGMQASTIKGSRDAKYRADAGLLANELIGEMWVGDRDASTLVPIFQGDGPLNPAITDGASYTAWATRVAATLPGATTYPPLVRFPVVGTAGPAETRTPSTAEVTVFWKVPNDQCVVPNDPNDPCVHRYRVAVQIF